MEMSYRADALQSLYMLIKSIQSNYFNLILSEVCWLFLGSNYIFYAGLLCVYFPELENSIERSIQIYKYDNAETINQIC